MFVMVAIVLLAFALSARFILSGLGVSITWRGTGYVLPPNFICVVLVPD